MITGLLIAILILLIELYLKERGGTILERVEKKVEKMAGQEGSVIFPVDPTAESMAKKIKKADKEGKDLKIGEDL